MTLVFDTTAFSALLSRDNQIMKATVQQQYNKLVVPLAADAEIRFGFANGTKETQNIQSYELFKRQFDITIAPPDQDTSLVYAELATWSRHHGVALSNNDIWIAATCMQLGGKLITLDQDFSYLPQIQLVNIT